MAIARSTLHPLGSALVCLALCLATLLVAGPASAQDSPPSVSELRRENEQLRLRIDELEAQLARSQQSIDRLLEQVRELNTKVADLQSALRDGTGGSTPEPGPDGGPGSLPSEQRFAELPEQEPFSAPEAMLRFARESYEQNFADTAAPFESSEAKASYLREIEAWSKSLRRSERSQIEWIIEIRRVINESRQPLVLEYRVLDPDSRRAYSDRVFTLELPSRLARRVLPERETDVWLLRGVAGLDLNINRDRDSVGFFDIRPFIGPFVEFGVDLSVSALLPAPEPAGVDEEAQDEDPDQNEGPGI